MYFHLKNNAYGKLSGTKELVKSRVAIFTGNKELAASFQVPTWLVKSWVAIFNGNKKLSASGRLSSSQCHGTSGQAR